MKKLFVALLAAAPGLAALAEGGSSQITLDTSMVTNLEGAFTNWAATVGPALITIAGVFVGFWLIKMVLRIIKGVASAGK